MEEEIAKIAITKKDGNHIPVHNKEDEVENVRFSGMNIQLPRSTKHCMVSWTSKGFKVGLVRRTHSLQ